MDWKNAGLAAGISLLFILQGVSCWRRSGGSKHRRSLGVLTILLSGLGLSSHFLLASGAMVYSPEFGILMVDGTAAWVALATILIGLPIVAAVGWHVSRCVTDAHSQWAWRVVIGAIVGALAMSRVESLDIQEQLLSRIRAYDTWWPVLPLWAGVCLVQSVLAIAHVTSRPLRAIVPTALAVGFSFWAIWHQRQGFHVADPQSLFLWQATLAAGLAGLMAATVWFLRTAVPEGRLRHRTWWIVLALLAAGSGISSSAWWLTDRPLPLAFTPWVLWLVSLAVTSVFGAWIVRRGWTSGTLRMPDIGRAGRRDDAFGIAALLIIILGLSDALYLRYVNAVLDLVLVLVGWATFVEVISIGPVSEFLSRPLAHGLRSIRDRTLVTGGRLSAGAAQAFTSATAATRSFFTFSSVGVGALRLLAVAAVLVAVAELPNGGKTVIVPFTELGLPEAESKHFGRMISHRVVNLYGTLARQFEPEVAILQAPVGGKAGAHLGLVASGGADTPEAVVSGDLEIGSVKIPVTLITSWIQAPMRTLLGVRVVTGSVQKDGDGYLLLAHSSDGGIFRVRYPGAGSPEAGTVDPLTSDGSIVAAEGLARELAYKLIATLPEMARAGMTQSWESAQPYALALEAWKRFEMGTADQDAVTDAIRHFRTAVRLDPGFALASYRLGLALTLDGQPFAATDALRHSLQANPDFALGYDALASHRYFNLRDYYRSPFQRPNDADAVVDDASPPVEEMEPIVADRRQALTLWHQLLQFRRSEVVARAGAHSGLCRMAFDLKPPADTRQSWAPEYLPHYIAYFHCRRAIQLYATLPAAVRDSEDVRSAEGSAWYLIGVALSRSNQEVYESTDPAWHCDAPAIATIGDDGSIIKRYFHRSPYTWDALRHYRRASVLLPNDGNLRCSLADAALNLRKPDPAPMRELETSSDAHSFIADALVASVSTWESDPDRARLALSEFERAFVLDPQNLLARNSYSYAVWKWHLRATNQSPSSRLPDDIVQAAERHARDAARLVTGTGRQADTASMRSTVGEVLLMQGRSHEAFLELAQAAKLAPRHAFYDEIRWELGLAALCAAGADGRAGRPAQPENFEVIAAEQFRTIRQHDEEREQRSLPDEQPLDRHTASALCVSSPGEAAAAEEGDTAAAIYALRAGAPSTDGASRCDSLAMAAGGGDRWEELADVKLRVFGPGVDALIEPLEPGAAALPHAWVTLPPASTHDLYFAQLQRQGGRLSAAVPLATRTDAPCTGVGWSWTGTLPSAGR
jgi:tetratricopeptide (TPR) repeat protein